MEYPNLFFYHSKLFIGNYINKTSKTTSTNYLFSYNNRGGSNSIDIYKYLFFFTHVRTKPTVLLFKK